MFILGLIIGLVIGANVGLLVIGLCRSAANADSQTDKILEGLRKDTWKSIT